MEEDKGFLSLHFILNPGSGTGDGKLQGLIREYFRDSGHRLHFLELNRGFGMREIRARIEKVGADRVIAAGGDGTIKLVAEALAESRKPLGILPTGSANGLARELGIPPDLTEALEIAVTGKPSAIHAVLVNGQFCVHLADLGFNAFLVKKFDALPGRGMWGYARAAVHALWNHRKMDISLELGGKKHHSRAAMVVIANATMYGTGVKINPEGRLDDDHFEVILVKSYSFFQILKLRFRRKVFNPEKIEFFSTQQLEIRSKHKAHLQVDGEYLGKFRQVEARILPDAVHIILPPGSRL